MRLLLIGFCLCFFLSLGSVYLKKNAKDGIIIGSKADIESLVISEIIGQMLEAHTDIKITYNRQLAGFLCFHSLLSGDISLYPEYTGTALMSLLGVNWKELGEDCFTYLQRQLLVKHNLVATSPLGAENTYALITKDTSFQKISQLAGSELTIGVDPEFASREEMKSLVKTYNLEDSINFVILEHSLAYLAMESGDIDLLIGYSTDPFIIEFGCHILEDDKKVLPEYEVFLLVNELILDKYPEIEGIFSIIKGQITTEEVARLNYIVEKDEGNLYTHVQKFLRAKEFT